MTVKYKNGTKCVLNIFFLLSLLHSLFLRTSKFNFSFIELDKTVVLWSSWLVFCDYGFSMSALWCPLAKPTILLGFLVKCMWGISSRLLQQSATTAPYVGRRASSQQPLLTLNMEYLLSALLQPLLGGGVAPLRRGLWLLGWGSSSWPPPLT